MDWTHFGLAVVAGVAGYFARRYMQPQSHSILDDLFAERAKAKAKQELHEVFVSSAAKEGTKPA